MLAVCLTLLDTPEEKRRFQEVYGREHPELLRYAASRLRMSGGAASGIREEAEDAVAEAFLKLAKNFQKYSHFSCSEMHRFLVTIVKHIIIDRRRKQEREPAWLDGDEADSPDSRLVQAALQRYEEKGGPEKYGVRREMMAQLLIHLEELPEPVKETFLMRHYAGMKPKEIARQLRLPVKTVEQQIYRAKIKLRECMEADGYEQGDADI